VTIAKRPSSSGAGRTNHAADLGTRSTAADWHDGQITSRAKIAVKRNLHLTRM
jgi:hypothetical protein